MTTKPILHVEDVAAVVIRLAEVLATEVDLLGEMKIADMGELFEEKDKLIRALERYKRRIAQYPELLDDMSEDQREELAQIFQIFQQVMEENHRQLLIAKSVNATIVSAIREAVEESAGANGTYSPKGHKGAPEGDNRFSVTYNESI